MGKILIIDDDHLGNHIMAEAIGNRGFQVETAVTLAQGIRKVNETPFDLVFLDVKMPDGNGLEMLPKIKRGRAQPEVIIITGAADEDGARLALKNGAWDYLQKPCSVDQITLPVIRALEYRREKWARGIPKALKREGIVGDSPQIGVVLDRVAEMAASQLAVLFTGETGTGKELFARAIHANSGRSKEKFVVVDCTVLQETLVESLLFGHARGAYTGAHTGRTGLVKEADGGTLFLDEVGELPLTVQKSFLRVLQEYRFRPVGSNREQSSNFRLVTATNRDLDGMVARGEFRQDLLFRIRSSVIELPALRGRREDIKPLAVHYVLKHCEKYGLEHKGFSPDFIDVLESYPWPGNIRELVNALDAAVVSAHLEPSLYPNHLPREIRLHKTLSTLKERDQSSPKTLPAPVLTVGLPSLREYRQTAIREVEKEYLLRLMDQCNGKVAEACRVSGLGHSRLYALLKEHDVHKKK